jgi:hypothetical protein
MNLKRIEAMNFESTNEMNLPKIKRGKSLVNIHDDTKETTTKAYSKTSQNESFKRIKSLIKESLYNSLAQSVIKILETPIFTLKVFLTLCVISSSGLCSFMIIELIMSFFSFGVSTTSRTLYETPALFPKITICNINPFTTQYAMEFLKQINREIYPQIDVFNDTQMGKLDFLQRIGLVSSIKYKAIFKMNDLNDTKKRMLSRPLEEILLFANPNDFLWFFDSWLGNCWIYNSGFNKSSHRAPLVTNNVPGETLGLEFGLYVNFYQNLTLINSYNGGLGAVIRIENSSYLTYYKNSEGIRIEPGSVFNSFI